MKVLRVTLALLRERLTRVALTTIAIAAAVCMVIWISSSYDALHRTYDDYANLALGRYELAIAPISADEDDFVTPAVLMPLRQDAAVMAVEPMWANRFGIRTTSDELVHADPTAQRSGDKRHLDGPGTGPQGVLPSLLFLATDAQETPFDITAGSWLDFDSGDAMQVVLRDDVAERRGLAVDDIFIVELPRPGADGESEQALRVVGIFDAPALPGAEGAGIPMLTPSTAEAFIPISTAERIASRPHRISLVGVAMNPEADVTQFRFGWAPRLSSYATPLQFQEAFEIEEALDQAAAAENVRLQSYAATAVAMLVAVLVIYCALSMGVTERIRQYAVLRAVVFTRTQIGLLVLMEGIALALLGLIFGVAVGWSLLQIVEAWFNQLLHHGIGLGSHSLLLAIVAAIGGVSLAAIVPVYRATQVKPIDAMTPRRLDTPEASMRRTWVVVGLLLVALNPLLSFVITPQEEHLGWATAVGLVSMAIGFILIAPAIVVFVDRWFSPILAHLFRIDAKLLACQITSNIWRTVGASVSMAFGLSLFIGIQVWGATMLAAFIPGDWTPDAIVMLKPGLPPDRVDEFAELPGIDATQCMPLVVEQPRLVDDLTNSAERASVTRQDNVVIVGLDPGGAFAGVSPLLRLEWVAGSPATAVARMRQGHACVVPDHFLAETGLKLGDTIALDPPRNAGHRAVYEIAGAVKLPGWHWQTKMTGLRPRTHRAAALIFADYDSVSQDFDLKMASHIWFTYANGLPDLKQIEESTVSILTSTVGENDRDVDDQAISARVVTVQGIREQLEGGARRWLWVISYVPLIALLIACLGVVNVMLASVRARRWEFGVMRAMGITAGDLTKAIIVEGVLIALVASFLSLGFGILSGWCGCGMAQYLSFFGGLHPPLVIPWAPVIAALAFALLLGIAIAMWPAISIGRTRPMELLQVGSDAM
ncbi:ABC transporter permease [Allorhodopirellula heiligendammensis]|uniref:Macrolide export ATP-binding/permease protein MacB n=1 Tax=Allorhodopirellula heiligendammensis TaxID=2714739 RepID=A0A5C6BFU3_9BACT|nr:ABC transporter permease [Allorhodopirellula heiligendammensis]TWU10928.1 Macrolide export ATP-binding/permease protein MacB [Allorhodopirellula heiligendammensis]